MKLPTEKPAIEDFVYFILFFTFNDDRCRWRRLINAIGTPGTEAINMSDRVDLQPRREFKTIVSRL